MRQRCFARAWQVPSVLSSSSPQLVSSAVLQKTTQRGLRGRGQQGGRGGGGWQRWKRTAGSQTDNHNNINSGRRLAIAASSFLGLAVGIPYISSQTADASETENNNNTTAPTASAASAAPAVSTTDRTRYVRRKQLKIFSGTANIPLAQEICDHLHVSPGKITVKTFADGEIGIQVHENVRGKDVYIVQPTCPPGVNDHLMELILMISTMRRASARRITAIIPYYGYARQDRKMQARVPISAAEVARMLEHMGVDRVVAVDLHCGQIQGFFGPRTPCDNLDGAVVALPYFTKLGLKGDSTVIVSPDAGGVHRAKKFRDNMKRAGIDCGLAMIIKQRSRANAIDRMDLVGNVEGCDVIIVDDMIDTAGTLCKAGAELKKRGAKRIYAFATHGLFSPPAIERIRHSDFEKVVVCNTVPLEDKNRIENIDQLSIATLLAAAIERIHYKQSVSQLFEPNVNLPTPDATASNN